MYINLLVPHNCSVTVKVNNRINATHTHKQANIINSIVLWLSLIASLERVGLAVGWVDPQYDKGKVGGVVTTGSGVEK